MQRGFAAKELEWVREEDVPDAQGTACPYTAAVTAAAGMSEQALAQWMDSFPAEGRPEMPTPSVTQQDKAPVSSAHSCLSLPTVMEATSSAASTSYTDSDLVQHYYDARIVCSDRRALNEQWRSGQR